MQPIRSGTANGVIVVALGVWTFWPGQTNTPKLGLDLRGGTQVILTPTGSTTGGAITDDQLKQTVEIIRQRHFHDWAPVITQVKARIETARDGG